MAAKKNGNEKLVNHLMTKAEGGFLMQAFIIEAISVYSQLVQAEPEKYNPMPGFIHQPAWERMAAEAMATMENWNWSK